MNVSFINKFGSAAFPQSFLRPQTKFSSLGIDDANIIIFLQWHNNIIPMLLAAQPNGSSLLSTQFALLSPPTSLWLLSLCLSSFSCMALIWNLNGYPTGEFTVATVNKLMQLNWRNSQLNKYKSGKVFAALALPRLALPSPHIYLSIIHTYYLLHICLALIIYAHIYESVCVCVVAK